MATEEGIIIKVNETTAMVRTKQMTACESCAEKDTCHSGGEGSKKIMEVEAENTVKRSAGGYGYCLVCTPASFLSCLFCSMYFRLLL